MSLRGLNRLSLSTLSDNNSNKPPPSSSSTHIPLSSYFNESNIHQDITLSFTLPGGEVVEEVVKVGETVQEIKRKMCSASKIPSHSVFLLNGTPMLDPLSLNDIPGVVGHTRLKIEVKVKGQTTTTAAADVITKRETTSGPDARHHTTSSPSSSSPHTSTQITTATITDKQHEQVDKQTDTSTDRPIENAEETTREQMYTTGNGKDERSNTSSHDGPDDLDTSKKGKDSPSTKTFNFVEPPPSSSFSSSSSSSPDSLSTIPSLPHAAFDEGEPTTTKSGLEKPRSGHHHESETTIDVNDDESSQKQIQTLGGGKRWFCEVI